MVLAVVLPSLLIVPFIFVLQRFKPLEEWKVWIIIYGFLGGIIALSLWLAFRTYPTSILSINNNEINLSFKRTSFLSPPDFSFSISDIKSFRRSEIGGYEYYIFEIQNPFRKFQVSSASNSFEDLVSLDEAMLEISELVSKTNKPKE